MISEKNCRSFSRSLVMVGARNRSHRLRASRGTRKPNNLGIVGAFEGANYESTGDNFLSNLPLRAVHAFSTEPNCNPFSYSVKKNSIDRFSYMQLFRQSVETLHSSQRSLCSEGTPISLQKKSVLPAPPTLLTVA
jgi:hypothetical protein